MASSSTESKVHVNTSFLARIGVPQVATMGMLAAGTVALTLYGVQGRSSQLFGPSSYQGSRRRRSVALTFDDGPSPGTHAILDYLADQNIKATFFLCGMNVLRHPEIARRTATESHEIGNHTYSHARLCPRISRKPNVLTPAAILHEFALAQEIIVSETGVAPSLLRAPYGMRWFGLAAAQRKLHLHGVMWSAIAQDWKWSADRIARQILRKSRPGAIFCLHDGRDTRPYPDIRETLAAVRIIVPVLKDHGYSFECVSNILSD